MKTVKPSHSIKKLLPFLFAALLLPVATSAAQTHAPGVQQPQAPVTNIVLFDVPQKDIDGFVAEWNKRSGGIAKTPGFISATLYQSILPDHPYPLIAVAQWQSYTSWADAHHTPANRPNRTAISGFYRPAIAYTHYTTDRAVKSAEEPLDRVKKDPAISHPDAPFVFINLMQMEQKDIAPFLADWQRRSQLTRRQAGSMHATLYKNLLPGNRFPIINVSQWQSYNAFIDAQNDATYSRQLEKDLNQTSSVKLVRGFFRPVAYQIQTYD